MRLADKSDSYRGALEPPVEVTAFEPFAADKPDWRQVGADDPRDAIEAAVASVKRARRRSNWGREKAAG